MTQKLRRILNLWFVIALAGVLLAALIRSDYGFSRFNSVKTLSGWETHREDGQIRMQRVLDHNTVGSTLMFYTTDAFVSVLIDDYEVYSYGKKVPICKSPGSMWQFVELPVEPVNYGRTLTLQIRTVYPEMLPKEVEVFSGSSGEMLLRNFKKELPQILANLLLLIYGVFSLVIYRVEKSSQVEDTADYMLGILCILTFLWSSTELFTFQLVFPSGTGQYFLYYICFYLMPLVLIWYVEAKSRQKVMVTIPLVGYKIFIAVLLVLQLTGKYEFTETLPVFLIVAGLMMIGCIIYITGKSRIIRSKMDRLAAFVLMICVAFNIGMYFMNDPSEHVSLLPAKIGLIIYVTINTYVSFEHLIADMVKISENEKIRDIAYMDQLTQIGNRYAFVRDIETIDYRYIGIVSMDLNNLKYYNDTMGHAKGDRLIKDAADLLKELFEGSLYRTGGDEFVSITAGKSYEDLEKLREELHRRLDKYNKDPKHDMILEIACGFAVFEVGDRNYEVLQNRADKEMYIDKARLKAVSPIKGVR